MLLEAKIPTWVSSAPTKWTTTATAKYVCRDVRVPRIEVWKSDSGGKVNLKVVVGLLSAGDPKDVKVSLSIVSDDVAVKKKSWESFTADPPRLHPRNPEAEFEFTLQEFAALFGGDRAPLVRVIVDVPEN
jgi:hypothetical protein